MQEEINKLNGKIRELQIVVNDLQEKVKSGQDTDVITTWPKTNDVYWYITSNGLVAKGEYNPYETFCNGMWEIGNCFETGEEAHRALEKLKALKRLKDNGLKITGMEDGTFDIELDDYYSGWRKDAGLLLGRNK